MKENYFLAAYFVILIAIALAEHLLDRESGASRKRLKANYAFGALTLLVTVSLPVQLVGVALIAEYWRFGLLHALHVNAIFAGVLSFIALDAVNYLTHRLLHARLLWPFHAVHHSDLRLDHSSALRFHPVELIINLATASAAIMVIGASPAGVAAYSLVVAIWNLVLHTNLRAPPTLESASSALLLTPTLHVIHHSQDTADAGRNFGTVFSFWDRLFGTFRKMGSASDGAITLGVADITQQQAEDFHALLTEPFRRKRQAQRE